MVEYVFTLEDLARVRFAISPTWELAMSLRALARPATAGVHLEWVLAARELPGLAGLDLRPALALLSRADYTPDFLTPPPESPLTSVQEGLDQIARTPVKHVLREVALVAKRSRAAELPAFLEHPRRELNRLVAALATYWERVVEPSWPRVRALLDADIARRSRRVAEQGAGAELSDLHPGIRWSRDRLCVPVSLQSTVALAGRGLLLVPSAFSWAGPVAVTAEAWQPTLVYPARGVGLLWEAGVRADEAVGRLIGGTRARMLEALAAPISTTELSRRMGITPSATSQHLKTLAGAGLVSRSRAGREVLYLRTPLAEALLDPPPTM
ncbi:MAG: hypothetical protein QOE11_2289 [Solirubrobacteraceae bacterium]|jgi:DNA-binding transcriptional ArsR family regulator|nr:hypothetical protein [Solirubrobacteraceae bacterium]